uniref:Uncharacterized protein n=1 Tax=Plectus sambesii TaxID=2011161 RepID=A0A914URU3_9BILA
MSERVSPALGDTETALSSMAVPFVRLSFVDPVDSKKLLSLSLVAPAADKNLLMTVGNAQKQLEGTARRGGGGRGECQLFVGTALGLQNVPGRIGSLAIGPQNDFGFLQPLASAPIERISLVHPPFSYSQC